MQVKRTEYKFLLNRMEYLSAKVRLGAVMARDPYCTGENGYEVRSLYFDTISDRACAEKEDGLEIHEKIRARIYGRDDRVIKLESKKKVGQYQTKTSLPIDRATLEALCRGNYGALLPNRDPMALYFYQKLTAGMVPKAIIQYQRMSYWVPGNQTRVTFDFDIRATESSFDLFREPLLAHPILPSDQVIMEVKYNNFLFGYIKNALAGVNKSAASYSKYFSGRSFYRYMI